MSNDSKLPPPRPDSLGPKIQRVGEPRATFTSGNVWRPGIAEAAARVTSRNEKMRLLFGEDSPELLEQLEKK